MTGGSAVLGGAGWASQKAAEILARGDRDICWYCHIDLTDDIRTIDHFTPRARGGSNYLSNLVLACTACNHQKADLDPLAFIRRVLSRKPGKRIPDHVREPKPYGPRLAQRLVVPPLAAWDEGHDEVRERIAAVKRVLPDPLPPLDPDTAVWCTARINRKGFPDP